METVLWITGGTALVLGCAFGAAVGLMVLAARAGIDRHHGHSLGYAAPPATHQGH